MKTFALALCGAAVATAAHVQCEQVTCKIEHHKCLYTAGSHFGQAFSRDIPVCRDFNNDNDIKEKDSCHSHNTDGSCKFGATCNALPQMWAGELDHYNGERGVSALDAEMKAEYGAFGLNPTQAKHTQCTPSAATIAAVIEQRKIQGDHIKMPGCGEGGEGWFRKHTCTGTDTHYSIRTFHSNKKATDAGADDHCNTHGHKCGIGILDNKFECQCRACAVGEAGCSM
jgi:hypothetical protein